LQAAIEAGAEELAEPGQGRRRNWELGQEGEIAGSRIQKKCRILQTGGARKKARETRWKECGRWRQKG
jgi:hypothetical protein